MIRRLKPHVPLPIPEGVQTRRGLYVDVETTGLDAARHEIIELAVVPFVYGIDGTIYEVETPFQSLRQPDQPITAEVTALTGISDAMVAGQTINPNEVAEFAAGAVLVIAHNAAFDRRFLERFCNSFETMAWACSMTQVDWASEGYEGIKLSYLASASGFFYDGHRASNDCMAALELLSKPLPLSGCNALSKLLESARVPSWRIYAENSPFDQKEILKTRGYRWNGEARGTPKAWYIDVLEQHRDDEMRFLKQEIYGRDVNLFTSRMDAYNRFSDRA